MLIIDSDKCTGCRMCVMVCSLTKSNTFNPARSRISIVKWEEEGIMIPVMCQHCEDPPCLPCCPVDAVKKDREGTEAVSISNQTCIGCRMCMAVCPFGGPSFDSTEGKVVICDLCDGEPQCADICPTGALQYVRADRLAIVRKHGAVERMAKAIGALLGVKYAR